jgi:hypothetical protein
MALSCTAHSQDGRTLETKIADLMAQMPVSNFRYRDKLAKETYLLGEEGLRRILFYGISLESFLVNG